MAKKRNRGRGKAAKARDGFSIDPANPAAAARDLGAPGLGAVADMLRGIGFETVGTGFLRARRLGYDELAALAIQGLPQRILNLLPTEALAAGYSLDCGPVTPTMDAAARLAGFADWEAAAAAEDRLARDLGVDRCVRETWQAARTFSDAIGVVGYPALPRADGRGRESFLEPAPFGRPIVWMREWDRRDFTPGRPDRDPSSATFAQPEYFDIFNTRAKHPGDEALPGLGRVHRSRCIRLTTDDGYSVLQRGAEQLAALLSGGSSAAALLAKAGGLIWEQVDWAEQVAQDEAGARKIIDAAIRAWSSMNVLILPPGSKVTSPVSGSLSGVDSTQYALAWLVSGCFGIPMSKLFGLQPSGFSSDENSRDTWDRQLESGRTFIAPSILHLRKHTWAQTLRGFVPADMSVKWNPIRTPTTTERAGALGAMADALSKVHGLGVIDPVGISAALSAVPEADDIEFSEPPATGPATDPAASAAAQLPGTWLTAGDLEARTGVPVRKIKGLGRRRKIGRRLIGGEYEYRLEDVVQHVQQSIQEPLTG